MKYKNYVFDLYGTLVDIRTDEENPAVWDRLAYFYNYYGADYTGEELKGAYDTIINEMEGVLQGDNHEMYPEIQIENVFRKLFLQKNVRSDRMLAIYAGQFFRVLTTEYIRLYDGARELLDELKRQGAWVYLLSNAQRIFTEYEMRALHIYDCFDSVYISSDYSCKKPDEQLYRVLIKDQMLNPKETLMIGNDPKCDIEGAAAVGFDTCYIHSNISPKNVDLDTVKSTFLLPEMDLKKLKRIIL
ncbi:MAG: HAD family hydrolase [Coprococcus sp.]|nr:HAD family hydrolase [Coprococcus sp.]